MTLMASQNNHEKLMSVSFEQEYLLTLFDVTLEKDANAFECWLWLTKIQQVTSAMVKTKCILLFFLVDEKYQNCSLSIISSSFIK